MKYKWLFWSIFVLNTLRTVFFSIITPIYYKRIVDTIAVGGDKALIYNQLLHYIILASAFLCLGWFFGRVNQYCVSIFQSRMIKDLHELVYRKLHGHSYMFFADNFSGALVNKSRKFVRAFEVMHDVLMDRFWLCFTLLVGVFIVFFKQAPLIALMFLIMSLAYIFVVLLMSRKKIKYDTEEAIADSRVTASIADSITNSLSIKSSSSLEREKENFARVTGYEATTRLRAWLFGNKLNAIQSALSVAITVSVSFISLYLWNIGSITPGLFVLVLAYSSTIANSFWDLGQASTRFTKSLSDMKEMVAIMRKVPDVLDPLQPEKSRIQEGNIEIRGMHFNYNGNNQNVFDNFSLKIKSGEKVGLVGHSGSGKSTFAKLLMRFVDIPEGEILIDGQNIRNITQDDLRKGISYISQEPILFHRTIRDNIAYSKPDAKEEEIIEVSKKAHAHEFIMNLKEGYKTLVGERGVKLSGGERQRVAIARAMLKDAPILLLDEATSALDSISENYIQDSFNELMKGKTAIVIAHRLSTIQKMDRIIVLDHGKIVEEGTHKELLKKGGAYADLWNHQTGGFLE